jgi:hypothetical protein
MFKKIYSYLSERRIVLSGVLRRLKEDGGTWEDIGGTFHYRAPRSLSLEIRLNSSSCNITAAGKIYSFKLSSKSRKIASLLRPV